MTNSLHRLISLAAILTASSLFIFACQKEDPGSMSLADASCAPQSFTIWAGQHYDVGTVTVQNTADTLFVSYDLADGVCADELHIDYDGDIPLSGGGNPQFGHFDYSLDNPPSEFIFSVALADFLTPGDDGTYCGVGTKVAVHFSVRPCDDGSGATPPISGQETAIGWPQGDCDSDGIPDDIDPDTVTCEWDGSRWGGWIPYTVCCASNPDTPDGCTLTQGYWKNHHPAATSPGLQAAWPIDPSTSESALNNDYCGQSWLEALNTPPAGGNSLLILGKQWMAAQLNIWNGASSTTEVDAAIIEAAALIQDCEITDEERARAHELATILDNYNNGLADAGPAHCE